MGLHTKRFRSTIKVISLSLQNLKLHSEPIDACIAAYVAQMNRGGIITVDCCCGHGKYHDGVKARPLVFNANVTS